MILINKPVGLTSHDIVDIIRRKIALRRVGHAGTLDPFASGLLIILIGREETKRQSEFLNLDKTYEATLRLGATSSTDDPTGEIAINSMAKASLPLNSIEGVLRSFIGSYDQMPPTYSAKKIKGKKAYELARKGIHPELKPKCITIHSIDLLLYEWPYLSLRCTVSCGTYIRALARDIGEHLGCGGFCEKLVRTAIGSYSLRDALTIENDEYPLRLLSINSSESTIAEGGPV